MQLMRHGSLSTQLMLSFESISPQSDKRQKLIDDKGGGKDSPLTQLTMQTKLTWIDKQQLGTYAKSASAVALVPGMPHAGHGHKGGAGGLGHPQGARGALQGGPARGPVGHHPALVQFFVHGLQQNLCFLEQMQCLQHGPIPFQHSITPLTEYSTQADVKLVCWHESAGCLCCPSVCQETQSVCSYWDTRTPSDC